MRNFGLQKILARILVDFSAAQKPIFLISELAPKLRNEL
jgi:hypothetical protein